MDIEAPEMTGLHSSQIDEKKDVMVTWKSMAKNSRSGMTDVQRFSPDVIATRSEQAHKDLYSNEFLRDSRSCRALKAFSMI